MLLQNNISFVEEWKPLHDRHFSIDIAFPDIKLGIEVNGQQHYSSIGKLLPYYQDRHDLIVAAGWTLIELHYTSCFSNRVLQLIARREQPDYSHLFQEKSKISRIRGQLQKQLNDVKWQQKIMEIKASSIDFSKFGWVAQVAAVLNISHTHVKRWMLRHLPEVYASSYKRSTPTSRLPR